MKVCSSANQVLFSSNGIYQRCVNPVVTRDHIPLLALRPEPQRNPHLMERIATTPPSTPAP